MLEDPIVTEVRRVRELHAAQHNFDLRAIYIDIKAQEEKSHRKFVSFPAKRIKPRSNISNID